MPPPDSFALPRHIRDRADVVACIVGFVALPISAILRNPLNASNIAILLLIVAIAVAAGVATVFNPIARSPVTAQTLYIVRGSARASVLAAILAAAMTILAARLFMSQLAAITRALPAVMSILPAAFFGMLAGAITAGVRLPKLQKVAASQSESDDSPGRIAAILIVASVVGFLSLLIPQHRREPLTQRAPVIVKPTPSPAVPWHYDKPSELATMPAANWHVTASRSLGLIAPDSPVAISAAGDLLAFVDAQRQDAIKIVNLNSPDQFSVVPISQRARRFAFSSDARRMIFETNGNPRRLGIVDLTDDRVVFLPKPKANAIPDGDLVWWSATEVGFQGNKTPLPILDLDSLELTDSNSSQVWSTMSAADQGRLTSPTRVELPSGPHWHFEFRPAIATAEVPSDPQSRDWSLGGGTYLAIRDLKHDYSQFLDVTAAPGDRFLGTADGSKLIRIRQNEVLLTYFAVRPAPALAFKLLMHKSPEQCGTAFTAALAAGDLCALVYPPMTNPLNQKVVGPIRDRVKGVLRFSSWNGNDASAWLSEDYVPIGSEDIVADLHIWKGNRPELLVDSESRRWWSKIGSIAVEQRNLANLPAFPRVKPLEHASSYDIASEGGLLAVKNIVFQPAPAAAPQASPTVVSQNPPQLTQGQMRVLDPDEPTHQTISQFILSHHGKANRGDLNALVNDYADQVVYFKNGTVDRSFIFRDEAKSRAAYRQMSESIIYPITITELPPQHYQAHYQITYEGIKKDNRRVTGTSDVYLFLESTPNGVKILSQQSRL